MKKIEAIIQPHKLDEVKQALIDTGVEGITILRSTWPRSSKRSYGDLSWRGIHGRSPSQSPNWKSLRGGLTVGGNRKNA